MIEDLNQRFENKSSTLSNGVEIQSVTKTEDLTVNVACNNVLDNSRNFKRKMVTYAVSPE